MDIELRELVTNKKKVLLQIITFISNEKKWHSIQDISNSVGLVERSVQRYINYLHDIIKDCNNQKKQDVHLIIDKKKGVKLISESKKNIIVLEIYICESDTTILLLIDLLFEKYKSSLEYLEKNRDSNNYKIKNSLDKIQTFIKPMGLKVSLRKFCIVGSEVKIRYFINSIVISLYYFEEWPSIFHSVNKSKIDDTVNTMIESLHFEITPFSKRRIAYMLSINILRYRKNHIIDYSTTWDDFLPNDSDFEIKRVFESMYKSFHIDSTYEVNFSILYFMTKSFTYEVAHLKKSIIYNFSQKEVNFLIATDLFIKEFNKICSISLKYYDSIYFYILRGHLLATILKQEVFIFNKHIQDFYIETEFPGYYNKINDLINKLFVISNNNLFLEKEYLIELYFFIVPTDQLVSIFEYPIFVKLETDLPRICEKHIEDYIYDQFKYQFNIVIMKKKVLKKPNLTLTNIMLDKYAKKNVLLIEYPITNQNLNEIKKKLKEIKNNLNSMDINGLTNEQINEKDN